MTAFTSSGDGNWNDAATWGGGGYPQTSGDTATISAGHEVTIPSGITIECGAVTLNAGVSNVNKSKVHINSGRLNMNGALTTNTNSAVNLNGSAILDMKGNVLTMSGDTEFNFLGNSVSDRCKYYSSTTPSTMTGGAYPCRGNYQYCHFENLSGAIMHRSHSSAIRLTFKWCLVTNCTGKFYLEITGTSTSAEYDVQYNDFRNITNANPISAAAQQPFFDNQQDMVEGTYRVYAYNTHSSESRTATRQGDTQFRCTGMLFKDNVFYNWRLNPFGRTSGNGNLNQFLNNLVALDTATAAGNTLGSASFQTNYFQQNYCYCNTGDHPFPVVSPRATIPTMPDWVANIFDGFDANSVGSNWLLQTASAGTGTFLAKQNLFMGKGNLWCTTGNQSGNPDIILKANTVYFDNEGDVTGNIGSLALFEQAVTTVTSGQIRILNNLVVDFDSDTTGYAVAGAPASSLAADVIDYFSYNCGYGLNPNAILSPPLNYNEKIVMTGGVGNNDFSENPGFTDVGRSIRTFDTVCGGAGTVANALTEFLKRNGQGGTWDSDYNVPDLLDHVWAGYRVTNANLRGTGENGSNISAANFYDATRDLEKASQLDAYMSEIYA